MTARSPVAFEPTFDVVARVLQTLPRQRQPEAAPAPKTYTCYWCGTEGTGSRFQCASCDPLHPDHHGTNVRVDAPDILNLRLCYAACAYRMVIEYAARAFDVGRFHEARAVLEIARVVPVRALSATLRQLATS